MKKHNLKVPYIAVSLLSLIALLELPYGYYTFLKIAVTLCASITAYLLYEKDNKHLVFWLCVCVAILFNPVIPIHLTREIWSAFNVLVAGLFGFLAFKCLTKK